MILWRISRHRDLSGIGGLKASGRWHHAGHVILYLAKLGTSLRTSVGRLPPFGFGVPDGIRTRVTAVKGRCPRPLDDGDAERSPRKLPGDSAMPRLRLTLRLPR